VKTTAPKRYCVRPNTGIIPPGETVEVQGTQHSTWYLRHIIRFFVVILNYTKDQPTSLKCKDKFQVQTLDLSNYHVQSETELKELVHVASERFHLIRFAVDTGG
jgi:hypothetical protein